MKAVITITIIIIAVVGLISWVWHDYNVPTPQATLATESPYQANPIMSPEVVEEERVYWTTQLAGGNAQEAYVSFKQRYQALLPPEQHGLAHIFGEALYAVEGLEGITVCDRAFSFGCFHSFLGQAMLEHGTEVIVALSERCVEAFPGKFSGCLHGIGHGLVFTLGYEEEHLIQALKECTTIGHPHILFGCESGVFMEFNLGTLSERGTRARSADIHYPCTIVAEATKENCYYEHALWSLETNGYAYEDTATECDAIAVPAHRKACFYGLGIVLGGMASAEPAFVLATCDLLSRFSMSQTCILGASISINSTPQGPAFRATMCTALDDSSLRDYCMTEAFLLSMNEDDFFHKDYH